MKIQIMEKSGNEMKLAIDGIEPSFANELRRIMMVEIPTMAVEYVDFVKNDSTLNDEVLANRIGQVPLNFDRKAYNMSKSCKCDGKGCSLCQVRMTLKKKGNTVVYPEDFKSKAKDVSPVYGKTPLVELFNDQEIELEATAVLGTGKEHIKWQAAIVGYTNLVEPSKKEGEVRLCKKHLFHVKDVKGTETKPVECSLCKSLNESDGKFKAVEDSFLFDVEATSGLDLREIVSESAKILENKLDEFGKSVKKLK